MLSTDRCIQQFIDDYQNRLESGTMESYLISIHQLLSYCQKPYNEIKTEDIRNWLLDLENKEYKMSTIKNKLYGLRLFFQYCVEEELITSNPVKSIPLPKEEDRLPYYLTHGQLAQLRQHIEGRLKQRAVVEVLYATGVRISELIRMEKEDIDWSERMILIREGKGKKERIVLFTKECGEHLQSYLDSRDDDLPFVFLDRYGKGAIGKTSIQYWFTTYGEELGFYVTPHTMRHTFAAHLAMKGMTLACIQVLLGHDNPQTSQMYARLHQQAQKDLYDAWM